MNVHQTDNKVIITKDEPRNNYTNHVVLTISMDEAKELLKILSGILSPLPKEEIRAGDYANVIMNGKVTSRTITNHVVTEYSVRLFSGGQTVQVSPNNVEFAAKNDSESLVVKETLENG